MEYDELVRSPISHEDRIRDTSTGVNEKAFASQFQISKNDGASSSNNNNKGSGRGQNQNFSRGSRGRGGAQGGRGSVKFHKRNIQCYHCNKYGHFERECRLKSCNNNANYAQQDENPSLVIYFCVMGKMRAM